MSETSQPGSTRPAGTTTATASASPRVEEVTDVETGASRTPRSRLVSFLESYALLALLVLAVLFFSFWPQTSATFPTATNLRILLASQAVVGVIALGLLLPLLINEFDLSVGHLATLAAIVVAEYVSGGGSVVSAIALALLIGLGVGVINAFIVTRFHVDAVISTLGIATIITGVILLLTGGLAPSSNIPRSMTGFGTGLVGGFPIVFIALLVIAGIIHFVLSHTSVGRQFYAVGSNSEAATLVGLRTDRLRAATFLVGGLLCGIAGFVYVARAGGASPNLGWNFTFFAFPAAFLSAASVHPGRFNVWGTIIAVYFLAVVNNGLLLGGVDPYVTNWVNGSALIAGVALATVLHRRRTT